MQNAVLVEHLKSIEAPVELTRLVGEDDLATATRRMVCETNTSFWIVWMMGASCVLLDKMLQLKFPVSLRHEGTGATPLHCAASRGNVEMVKLLLQQGADCVCDCLGGTPLHDAARRQHPEVASALIEAGANVNARCQSGDYTPLFFVASASGTRAEEVAEILRQHGGVL